MIDPSEKDIGRGVVYQARHPGANREDGTITSFNDTCVFVRYGADSHSKGTRREDLVWTQEQPANLQRLKRPNSG